MMDAKNYIRRNWARDLNNNLSNHSALENILNDTRLTIELQPTYVVNYAHQYSASWVVTDTRTGQSVAWFYHDKARAERYAADENRREGNE